MSAFEATHAQGTAQLAALKVLATSVCVLAAIIAIGVSVWISVPLVGDAVFIQLWNVPATELATGLGSLQGVGFIMLGAFAALTGVVAIASLVDAMTEMLPPYRRQHVEANRRALELGAAQLPAGGAPVRFPEPVGRST